MEYTHTNMNHVTCRIHGPEISHSYSRHTHVTHQKVYSCASSSRLCEKINLLWHPSVCVKCKDAVICVARVMYRLFFFRNFFFTQSGGCHTLNCVTWITHIRMYGANCRFACVAVLIHMWVALLIDECVKRDLYSWKETYKTDLHTRKETCKRDLYTWKETYWRTFVMLAVLRVACGVAY